MPKQLELRTRCDVPALVASGCCMPTSLGFQAGAHLREQRGPHTACEPDPAGATQMPRAGTSRPQVIFWEECPGDMQT